MLNIIENRLNFFIVSGLLFLLSLFAIFWMKLNLWIDMTWWIQLEYDYIDNVNLDNVQELTIWIQDSINTNSIIVNNVNTYKVTGENTFIVNAWFDSAIEDKELEAYKISFKEQLTNKLIESNSSIELSKYINIWKSFWDYIKDTAKLTLILAIWAITIYIAYAFSWSVSWISAFTFAIVTIITLTHDVIISTWLYIFSWFFLPEFKIDTFFITALLTILWYSINDTIVVFDRIRSNLKDFWWVSKDLKEIITLSINETLTRSIYTSLTLLFVLFTIILFWPETVNWFILAMIYWTIVWTFSSIFIASPLLYEINKNKTLSKYVEPVYNPDGKIVV